MATVLAAALCFFFFFNDTATTEIYTLSLHDALPIWVFPGQVLESRDVVGIRQEPNVKNQVAIRRHTMAKPEAGDVDLNRRLIALPAEPFLDKIAQLVDRKPGGVDDQVRHGANRRQLLAFALDAAGSGIFVVKLRNKTCGAALRERSLLRWC